jgi:hypothetical protein
MTRHVTDDEMCPRGYLVRRGSALHRKYRNHPIAHDLDARRNSAPGRGSFPAVSERTFGRRRQIWMQRYLFQNIDRPTEMTK